MAGLLDVLSTPESQLGLGLLAAGGSGQRFGPGLLSAVQFATQAQQANDERKWQQMERAQKQKAWDLADRENALAAQFFKPAQAGVAPIGGDSASGILPSAGRPAVPASYDMPGYASAMMAVNPAKGMQILQALQKESPINKLDAKDFTPSSLAKFMQTKNYGDLVRLDKLHFADTGGAVSGLDPFTGQPVNAVAKTGDPFKDLIVQGPNGQLAPNSPLISAKSQIARAGASQNNISVNTEKSFLNEVAGGIGKQIDASLAGAKGAASTISTLNNLDAALNSGKVMAGPLTKGAQLFTQVGAQLGLGGKDAKETLQNTRAAMQAMAQLELDAAGQMKGQGQITESEREILRKAASGDINMTLPELKTLSAVSRRTAQMRIQQHNQNVQPLLNNPNAASLSPFLTVQPPSQPQANTAAGEWKILGVQ